MSEKSDIEIVRDIKNGSVSAFQELYSRYADIVYRNILARVNSSFDADDIFQDFFIQVWEKRDSFQVSSSVKGYLLIWLRNHILNSIKQEQIRDKYQDICAPNEEDNYTWVKIVARIWMKISGESWMGFHLVCNACICSGRSKIYR